MTTEEMVQASGGGPRGGFEFIKKITLTDEENSNAILMPAGQVRDIAYVYSGSPSIYVTIDSVDDIADDTATWVAVPSGWRINPAITAVKATNTTGTANITIKVRLIGG